jgi:hypothetical protein
MRKGSTYIEEPWLSEKSLSSFMNVRSVQGEVKLVTSNSLPASRPCICEHDTNEGDVPALTQLGADSNSSGDGIRELGPVHEEHGGESLSESELGSGDEGEHRLGGGR